jgi:hypothetical protein
LYTDYATPPTLNFLDPQQGLWLHATDGIIEIQNWCHRIHISTVDRLSRFAT